MPLLVISASPKLTISKLNIPDLYLIQVIQ